MIEGGAYQSKPLVRTQEGMFQFEGFAATMSSDLSFNEPLKMTPQLKLTSAPFLSDTHTHTCVSVFISLQYNKTQHMSS